MRSLPIAAARTTASATPTAIVAEAFVSFQGEGPLLGRRAAFVRLSRCNLTCSWCDTKYTWDWSRFDPRSESQRSEVAEIARWVTRAGVDLVIVTGGEPLLQQPAVTALARACGPAGVQIETNGTIAPDEDLVAAVDMFVVSPKLANSGVRLGARIRSDALSTFAASGKAQWKFVVTGVADLDEVATLVQEFGLSPVWIAPEGVTAEAVMDRQRALAGAVLARGWNLTTRLHTLLWGDRRGC